VAYILGTEIWVGVPFKQGGQDRLHTNRPMQAPNTIQNNGLSTVHWRVLLRVCELIAINKKYMLRSDVTSHCHLNTLQIYSHSDGKHEASNNKLAL
jgi:hypothetical protein